LQRLRLEFTAISPGSDEHFETGEKADDIVRRLATDKAMAVAAMRPAAVIIGSDQVLTCNDEVLVKPGNFINACAQLSTLSGRTAVFSTGLCVYDGRADDVQTAVVKYYVTFRDLQDEEIERYLNIEKPFDCAGSFKSEASGIMLTRSMRGDDPTALIGLPLIELSNMLRRRGFRLP
jgi:septum formation protein